jgi:hypothetical protein
MAYRNASTAKEILQIKREIEALKESMRPAMPWVEVTVDVSEDKSAEIAELEAKGFHVLPRNPAARALHHGRAPTA